MTLQQMQEQIRRLRNLAETIEEVDIYGYHADFRDCMQEIERLKECIDKGEYNGN